MAGMNSANRQPPSGAEVEKRALDYQLLTAEIARIAQQAADDMLPFETQVEALKAWFLENVQQFGSAHAEKSKILHGISMEAMVTSSQYSSIDAAAVETFRMQLKKTAKPSVINHIFERTVRWTLMPAAAAYIRENAGKLGSKLVALYAACAVTKDRAPRLEVRPKNKPVSSQQSA
jgi:hypothetical protein